MDAPRFDSRSALQSDVVARPYFGVRQSLVQGLLSVCIHAAAAIGLLTFVMLFVRRLSGALIAPLEPVWFCVAATFVELGVTAARESLRTALPQDSQSTTARIGLASFTAMALAMLLLLAVPGTSGVAIAMALVVVIAGEAYFWIVDVHRPVDGWRSPAESQLAKLARQREMFAEQQGARIKLRSHGHGDVLGHEGEPGTLTQTCKRHLTSDGRDHVQGQVWLEFAEGQRTAVAHIAFCPPLSRVPTVELSAAATSHPMVSPDLQLKASPDLQLKASTVQPYGLRIEGRLGQITSTPLRMAVAYSAIAPGENCAAESSRQA